MDFVLAPAVVKDMFCRRGSVPPRGYVRVDVRVPRLLVIEQDTLQRGRIVSTYRTPQATKQEFFISYLLSSYACMRVPFGFMQA